MAGLSYLSCPNPKQLQYRSVVDIVQERIRETPDKEICIHRFADGTREALTYGDLWRKATKLAKYLVSMGVGAGDSVAIIGPNSLRWIVGEFAIFMAGATAVHIQKTSETFKEIVTLARSAQCKTALLDTESESGYLADVEAYVNSEEQPQDDGAKLTIVLLNKSYPSTSVLISLEDVLSLPHEEESPLPKSDPESTAIIYTTSGTTGVPKMVELTHFTIVNSPFLTLASTGGDRDYGIYYNDRPFTWLGGTPIYNILTGNTRVFADTNISRTEENIKLVWDIIMSENCTNAGILPYALVDLLRNKEELLKHGYKLYGILTGGQMIGKHLSEICGKFSEKFFMLYGSTEIGIVAYVELTTEMEEGYVGEIFAGYEVKIIGDDGKTLVLGELGEILVKSPWMLKTYRNAPELYKASFMDGGWFRTGDIGVITKDNKLFIKGKATDVIKRGGMKVLASVVEGVISKIPGVKEVVVLPVPDVRLLEEVCACFVADETNITEAEIEKVCRDELGDNILGSSPSHYVQFDSFPRLTNGKPSRILIKRRALDILNIS